MSCLKVWMIFFRVEVESDPLHIKTSSDLFSKNAEVLELDFERLTQGKRNQIIADSSNRLICPERIFIEPGAKLSCAILNATDGPIYIGKNTEVMEGAMLRRSNCFM